MNNPTLERFMKKMEDIFGEYNIYDVYFGYDYEDERDYVSFDILDMRRTEFVEFAKATMYSVDVVIEAASSGNIGITLTDKNKKID